MRNGESMVPSGHHPNSIERDIAQTRARMDSILSSLEATLTPGMIFDRAVAYLKHQEVAKRAGMAAGRTAWKQMKANPLAFAIMGAGVAYWIFGGKDKESARAKRYASHPYDADVGGPYVGRSMGEGGYAYDDTRDDGHGFRETAGEKVEAARERVKGSAEEARHRAQDAKAKVSDVTSRATSTVRGAASNVKAKASDVAESAKARASDVGRSVKGAYTKAASSGRSVARQAKDRASRASSQLSTQAREHPFLFAGLAMMVSALIGALLRPTSREDRLLGPRRERVFRRADEMGARGVEKVRDMANRAFETAHEKVTSTEPSEVEEAIEAEVSEEGESDIEASDLEATGTVPPSTSFEGRFEGDLERDIERSFEGGRDQDEKRSSGDELGRS